MIGIIGAMPEEVNGIKNFLSDAKSETISGIEFITGCAYGKDIVVAQCGVGKVNAAICTEAMILKYSPECIVNTGIAGCLTAELDICDIAIADKTVQYDMDTTAFGDPLGFISGLNTVYLESNCKIVEKLTNAAKTLKDTKLKTGTTATGDIFVYSAELRKKITDNFNAIANDMEGASIAHVCRANRTDFGIIRVMSDNADNSLHMDYDKFKLIACDKSVELIKKFIEMF